MFKYRWRAKPESKSAGSSKLGRACAAQQAITYEFVASFDTMFDADASASDCTGDDSGIYTMCPEDSFAVLREVNAATANEKTQGSVPATANSVPKVIAVILEPDGQSRFFHPEESRRAGRPIWQPLQPVES